MNVLGHEMVKVVGRWDDPPIRKGAEMIDTVRFVGETADGKLVRWTQVGYIPLDGRSKGRVEVIDFIIEGEA